MKQTRLTSLFKSLFSTAVGFAVAFVANMAILPLFGLPISHSANLLLTTIYTGISIARGYVLERVFEALGWRQRISPFMSAVIAERHRQQDVEGWSLSHDDDHDQGDLALAGAVYARYANTDRQTIDGYISTFFPPEWPWSKDWWKPTGFRRDLVKGAALIVAEGEKFDRTRKLRRAEHESSVTDDRSNTRSPIVNQNNLAFGKTPSEQGGASA